MIKLFRFLKPFAFLIAGVLVLIFLQTLADLYLPTLMSDIIDKGVMNGDTNYIIKTGSFMLLIAAGGTIASIIASFLSSRTAVGFGRIVRNKIFARVESFSLHEFDKFGTSTLITRTTNDITQVQMVTVMIMRMLIGAPMMAIGGIIMALNEDKPLTLVLVVALPVLAGVIIFIAKKGMPLFTATQKKIDKINLVLREKLTGIRVIRAFNQVEHERQRFEAANEDLTQNYIKINRLMAFLMPSLMLVMNLSSLAILWFGIIRIDNGSMHIGSLIAFTQYAMQILFSMLMVSMMFIMVPRAQAASIRINEVLDTIPEINDPSQPQNANILEGQNILKGHVEFKNVTFSYHGAEQPALYNITFTALPGQTTAIIGSTGSGKTSLINLIPRFYDVDEGHVLVNGIDVRHISQKDLRNKIGFVPQKAILFSGSVRDNIKFGIDSASEGEIMMSAEIAQATDFIAEMDGKYDHIISQGGTNVSGGQKQRLSIARALVRKPEIYIFDDSFSALDFKTDAKLRIALKKVIEDSTVILVAQRVGTVMDADQIIVLDNGRIAGIGKHRELLGNCEVYREIVSSQLSEEEIA